MRATAVILIAALIVGAGAPAAYAQGDGMAIDVEPAMGGEMAVEVEPAMGGEMAVEVEPAMGGENLVVIETVAGTFTIELFDEDAPNHAANFRALADSGYYNGTLFHRIIPGFMIQGGDDNTIDGDSSTWGQGGAAFGPEESVAAEFNDIRHMRGIVSMARSASPDSAGSQFFIVHDQATFLDGQYTAFGRVVTADSLDALDAIAALETASSDQPVNPEDARVLGAYTIMRSEAGELLELGAPERLAEDAESEDMTAEEPSLIDPITLEDGVYTNKKLGVSFEPPEGWNVTELPTPKQSPNVPDIVVVGPADDNLPPVISVDIQYMGDRTLDAYIETRNESRAAAIESGELVLDDPEEIELNGRMAMSQDATGTFVTNDGEEQVAFREVIFESGDKFYGLTYMSTSAGYDAGLGLFEETLETFMTSSEMPADAEAEADADAEEMTSEPEGGGCLIATAAYGTEMAHEVQILRETRDSVLGTATGSAFMSAFNGVYYAFSPTVADWERESPEFRALVRALITPMVASLSIMSAAGDDASDIGVASLGALVIALNVGMYVAAPAALAWRLRR